jgi:hypothetical protein
MSLPLYHNNGQGNKKRLLPYKIPKSDYKDLKDISRDGSAPADRWAHIRRGGHRACPEYRGSSPKKIEMLN